MIRINYDRLTQYCPVRRNLEERSFNLVGRLAVLTDRLLQLIGHNHFEFFATKTECASLRAEIMVVRRDLNEHRVTHRC